MHRKEKDASRPTDAGTPVILTRICQISAGTASYDEDVTRLPKNNEFLQYSCFVDEEEINIIGIQKSSSFGTIVPFGIDRDTMFFSN